LSSDLRLAAESPCCTSVSKQLYSFAKSARFKPDRNGKKVLYNFHYNPEFNKTSRIPTTFGVGKRESQGVYLKHMLETPHSSTYMLPSTKTNVGCSFGPCRTSREKYSVEKINNEYAAQRGVPGPGAYRPRDSETEKLKLKKRSTMSMASLESGSFIHKSVRPTMANPGPG
jgi:hypothetical protein